MLCIKTLRAVSAGTTRQRACAGSQTDSRVHQAADHVICGALIAAHHLRYKSDLWKTRGVGCGLGAGRCGYHRRCVYAASYLRRL